MTVDAIQLTTEAFRGLLEAALTREQAIENNDVFAGPPSDPLARAASASLFLYHLVPNADLRNETDLASLRGQNGGQNDTKNTIPFDLRYLITGFPPAGQGIGSSPIELLVIGAIISAIHETPVLTGARLPGQTVRLTPDPISMEDISRVWSLLPETPYMTSIVYLATPVFVDAPPIQPGPRVREVHRQTGRLEEVEPN